MKLKKHISKFLFFSILLNNIYFYSNAASNSNLNRYQTLEGEFIDLGDTKSEDISEIEIFGNTVQNPDNLEDIQSVGDLYVDNEGNPILDALGREQYRVDIKSYNKSNLFNEGQRDVGMWSKDYNCNSVITSNGNYKNIEISGKSSLCYSGFNFPISFAKGKKYKIEFTVEVEHIGQNFRFILTQNPNGANASNCVFFIDKTATTQKETKISVIGEGLGNYGDIYGLFYCYENGLTIKYNNITINEVKDELDYYKQNKTTILLPCQLMKVGDTADRLYWDKEKEKYVIKKNTLKFIPESVTRGISEVSGGEYISLNRVNGIGAKDNKLIVGSNIYIGNRSSDWVNLRIDRDFYYDKGYTLTESDANRFLRDYPITVICATTNPQLIETNIIKQIQLTTYPEKTYISIISGNRVNTTLKIYVDKIEEVSGEAVDNAISTPTSNNISIARMFVNLLPESLYKDELQAQLNNIFSENMVLDRLSATANLDVYIQSENILMMSLNTNTVTFEDYSGVEELELNNAIGISINSSLPYQLNAYIVGEITNKDKDKTLDLDVFNIKDSSTEEYKKFDSINNKLVLLDNMEKGNNISHNIDLKLSGNKAHDADVYKTTIKFEAEQK